MCQLNNSVIFSGRAPRSSIFLTGWKSLLGFVFYGSEYFWRAQCGSSARWDLCAGL